MGQVYARDIGATAPKPSAKRPLFVRRPSAERRLELDGGIPRAQLSWQVEFITCPVGDTTHSGCHNLLVYLYKLRDHDGTARGSSRLARPLSPSG